MPTIHFPLDKVQILMDHAKAAPEHWGCYGSPCDGPELVLVGDQGIYLMSNGTPPLLKENPKSPDENFVVYATECDPDTDPDGWYDSKVAYYGGDDGADSFTVASIESLLQTANELNVTPKMFAISIRNTTFKLGLV